MPNEPAWRRGAEERQMTAAGFLGSLLLLRFVLNRVVRLKAMASVARSFLE
jgi:hypothetical protein